MKVSISRKAILSILPILFYLFNLYRMLGNSTIPYQIILFITGIIGIVILFIADRKSLKKIIYIFLIYFITLIFNWLIIGNHSVNDIVQSALLFGIAIILLIYPWTFYQGLILFGVTCITFIINMCRGIPAHLMLTSSGNYISVVLLLSVTFFYIAIEVEKRTFRTIDLLPAVICFVMSVWAKGRGGILSCGLLLIFVLLFYMRCETSKKRGIVMIVIAGVLLIILLLVSNVNVLDQVLSLGRWKTSGIDNSAREIIWNSYFVKLKESLVYVLMGAPLDQISVIKAYEGNCHNSFLQLHAYNGLLMTLIFFFFLVKAFRYYIIQKRYLILSVFLVLCIRGFTDKFIFGQYGMPIMLYLALFPLIQTQNESINSQ